jgi:diadenylate cyclase
MNIIALYLDGRRYVLEDSATILSKANQALATLERYRARLDEVAGSLSTLEIEDLVTARDVSTVVQRHEMVRRISNEIAAYVIELGTDGRLLSLQLEELVSGTAADLGYVIRDYMPMGGRKANKSEVILQGISELDATALLDVSNIAEIIGLPSDTESLDNTVHPRGFRLLAKVPRLPEQIFENLISHFGSLQYLLSASAEELRDVEGVGETRARAIRENLSRVAEASLLERYV